MAHLAGVLDDALLSQQSLERFRTTLAPKALGAWHLHRLTKNDDLEFFIVYSSASSVLGSPGQANYATANALLDGLVADREAQGLPATSINWGPWAKGGMATSHAARANLSAQGLIPLEPTAALNALDEIVAHGIGQATVIKANWQRAAKGAGRLPPVDSRPRAAECRRGDARRQRVAPATARGARGGARQFPHRIPTARSTEFPEARATAGRNQQVPGVGHGFTDGGRIQQPVGPPVRWRVHDQRHRGIRLPDDRVARRVPGRPGAGVGLEPGGAESVDASESDPVIEGKRQSCNISMYARKNTMAHDSDTTVAMSAHLADDLLSTTAGGWRSFYDLLSRRLEAIGVADSSFFLNYGYLPTDSDNESAFVIREGTFNANSVRLVFEVLGSLDLNNRTVAEIGCGRGGNSRTCRREIQRSRHRHRYVLGSDRILPKNPRRRIDRVQGW